MNGDFISNLIGLKVNGFFHRIHRGASPRKLYIQPVGPFPFEPAPMLDYLQKYLTAFYNTDVVMEPCQDVNDLNVSKRRHKYKPDVIQYSISDLVRHYHKQNRNYKDRFGLVLLTGPNLHSSNVNALAIMGQTHHLDSIAVCSIGQYLECINFSQSINDYFLPILRVSTHEIAHLYGLPHCLNNCGMLTSKSGDEAMTQPLFFCRQCIKMLRRSSKLTKHYIEYERPRKLATLLKHEILSDIKSVIFKDALEHYESKIVDHVSITDDQSLCKSLSTKKGETIECALNSLQIGSSLRLSTRSNTM